MLLLCLVYSFSACEKTVVQFGSDGVEGDPAVVMIDTFRVGVSTLQLDSFSTTGSKQFIVGLHKDPQLGSIAATSYFELSAPTLDLRDCNTCVFDSLVLNLKPSSGYMGDTTAAFTIRVNEVTQSFTDDEITIGRNVNSLAFNPVPLAEKAMLIRPSAGLEAGIRLSDAFGKNLFRMLRTNSDTITDKDKFRRFLKGMVITSPASNNAIYYFTDNADSALIKLHYTIAGATPTAATTTFTRASADHQFNAFSYDKTGTAISSFTPKKKLLINSESTGNAGYLHYNSGLFPKISFGSLLSVKELHPYVQVMRAELVIPPAKGSYGINTVYNLPPAVELQITDDGNYVGGAPVSYSNGSQSQAQTGSLYIDNLYGESTGYIYDVTGFVNTIISEGAFSKKALVLYPQNTATNDQRLLINNRFADKPIKLKLYILGL